MFRDKSRRLGSSRTCTTSTTTSGIEERPRPIGDSSSTAVTSIGSRELRLRRSRRVCVHISEHPVTQWSERQTIRSTARNVSFRRGKP